MRTTAMSRAILLSLGVAATLSTAACAANKPPSSADPGHGHTVRPAVSPAPIPTPIPAASPSAGAQPGGLPVPPSQLPGFQVEAWVAHSAAPAVTVTGHNIEINECASVDGATTWQQQAYNSNSGDSANLDTYTFPSAGAASTAYTGVLAGMNQCQSTSRALQTANNVPADAVVTKTAQIADAAAFERTWTGVPGVSAGGPQINHLYIALNGTNILDLEFSQQNTSSSSAAIYNVLDDPAVLTMLTNALADHAGKS